LKSGLRARFFFGELKKMSSAATAGTATSAELRTISPNLPIKVMRKLSAFIEVKRTVDPGVLAAALRRLQDLWQEESWSVELRAVALVLADLTDQGWDVTAEDDKIYLQPPGLRLVGETAEQSKDRLRRALQTGRDRQLADPGVQKFLNRMHRVVPREPARTSIADVIDNGAELVEALRRLEGLTSVEVESRLKDVVDPVVEVCDEVSKCTLTGLRLIDIWRYFRHTWSLEYRSVPGRQMALLIRNAARPKRPIIGIAMLASPVLRMRVRDNWIGWNSDAFVAHLRSGKWDPEVALRALVARLEKNIVDIRSDDLVSPDEIAFPNERTILRLEQKSAGAAISRQRKLEEHYSEAEEANEEVRSQRDPTRGSIRDFDWLAASEEILFVRKRAETLGRLLDAKRTFQALDWTRTGISLLDAMLHHPNGLRTLGVALQEVRKAGLSSQVADVSVCGAVAPYNFLLGGKLVALLTASNEVRDAYRSRYGSQVSIISSQMAGRPLYRPAELKILTTTSLYGNGSSQYNRLRLRACDHPEMEFDLEWKELAQTAGYGTVHLSPITGKVLREIGERSHRARRINHRFGEGASPRLRQIREAMEALGIDSSAVLHHATPRVFFGCELHPGAIDELLGLTPTTASEGLSARIIANLWRQRWLSGRVKNKSILERIGASNAQSVADYLTAATSVSRDAVPMEEGSSENPLVSLG
jgi:hypothetical protein